MMSDPNSQEFLFVTNLTQARPDGTSTSSSTSGSSGSSSSSSGSKSSGSSTSGSNNSSSSGAASQSNVGIQYGESITLPLCTPLPNVLFNFSFLPILQWWLQSSLSAWQQ